MQLFVRERTSHCPHISSPSLAIGKRLHDISVSWSFPSTDTASPMPQTHFPTVPRAACPSVLPGFHVLPFCLRKTTYQPEPQLFFCGSKWKKHFKMPRNSLKIKARLRKQTRLFASACFHSRRPEISSFRSAEAEKRGKHMTIKCLQNRILPCFRLPPQKNN